MYAKRTTQEQGLSRKRPLYLFYEFNHRNCVLDYFQDFFAYHHITRSFCGQVAISEHCFYIPQAVTFTAREASSDRFLTAFLRHFTGCMICYCNAFGKRLFPMGSGTTFLFEVSPSLVKRQIVDCNT